MAIIEDKYKAKGLSPRSKHETSDVIDYSNQLSTEQRQAQITEAVRMASRRTTSASAIAASNAAVSVSTASPLSIPESSEVDQYTIIGSTIMNSDADALTAPNILKLNAGEKLVDIIFSHYDPTSQAVASLYWSIYPPEELEITVGSGLISSVTKGTIFRIFTDTFPSGGTLSLKGSGIDVFNNLNKAIYFYVAINVAGMDVTMITS